MYCIKTTNFTWRKLISSLFWATVKQELKTWASVFVCLFPSRLAGGRTATCVCVTIPGLVTALSWSLWMMHSTSEWLLWKRGPLSLWNRLTREPAHAFGTLYPAECPLTPGNTRQQLDIKQFGGRLFNCCCFVFVFYCFRTLHGSVLKGCFVHFYLFNALKLGPKCKNCPPV